MFFFGIKNFWFRLGVFLPLSIAAAFFVWKMYESYFVVDPYNPNLEGTARYGHNYEGNFQTFAVMTLIEYGILLAALIPFSFSRLYFLRPLILQIFFGGWLLLLGVASMHGGGVDAIHLFWILAVNVIIFVLLIASIAAEIGGRKKQLTN